jgi:hypothetical protein
MNMVSFTTSGAPSCPRGIPVEKVQATFRFATLLAVIAASSL